MASCLSPGSCRLPRPPASSSSPLTQGAGLAAIGQRRVASSGATVGFGYSTGSLLETAASAPASQPTGGRHDNRRQNNLGHRRQSRHRTGAVRTGRCRRGVSEGRDTVQLRVDQVSDGRRPVSLSAVMTSARSPATAAALAATLGLAAGSWVVAVREMDGMMDMGVATPARFVRVLCRPVGGDDGGDDAAGSCPGSLQTRSC